jgi:hypothetical protein
MRNIKDSFKASRLTRISTVILVIFLILIFENYLLMVRYERVQKNKQVIWGASFSQVQAERYGSDWRKNYLALLDDLNFKKIRISAYWDRIEPSEGKYDFSEVEWMLDEADKRGTKVTLVIGQKNLRYPECYYPEWVNLGDSQKTSDQAIAMIQNVAEHFKSYPALEKWQLENEFLLKSFGKCEGSLLTNEQLKKELTALQSVDNTRKIVLTQSDQFGFPVKGPFADEFGVSMYRWSWDKRIGYWRYPQNGKYFWWKASLINAIHGQDVIVHELQAEPWGPLGNENISASEASRTMDSQKLLDNIEYGKETRMKEIYLWGSEWWWHTKQLGQNDIWETVKKVVSQ